MSGNTASVVGISDELVTVSVPRKHLTKVYGFIADLEAGRSSRDAVEEHEWTPDLVRRAYAESAKPMKGILWEMASHPNEELSTAELASGMKDGANWNNVAGALGAFGRRVKSRYRMAKPPFDVGTDEDGRTYYRMDDQTAEVIREMPRPGRPGMSATYST